MFRPKWLVCALGMFLWSGCDQGNGKKTEAYVPRPKGTVTFNKDIAPIIFTHCSGCHRTGESAPFQLLGYEDVRKRAKQVVFTNDGLLWLGAFERAVAQAENEFRAAVGRDVATVVALGLEAYAGVS